MTRRKMTLEEKQKLSAKLKANWASGTRKPAVLPPPSRYREMSLRRDSLRMSEHGKRIGEKNRGVPKPPGPNEKGPSNIRAKYWVFKSPQQQIIKGVNLNELIRKNAELFDPVDVVWRGKCGNDCNAAKGLRRLFVIKKDGTIKHHSWKGWMIGDRMEQPPNVEVTGLAAASLPQGPCGLPGSTPATNGETT